MMRRTMMVAAFLLALLAATRTVAQEEKTVGVGASMGTNLFAIDNEDLAFIPLNFTDMYIPVNIGSSFRIEPGFGILMTSSNQTSLLDTTVFNYSGIRIGAGVYYRTALSPSLKAYVGPRAGAILYSSSQKGMSGSELMSLTQTTTFFGVGGGGEYYFVPNFSVGGEIQFNYYVVGDRTFIINGGASTTASGNNRTLFFNSAIVLVRWYIF